MRQRSNPVTINYVFTRICHSSLFRIGRLRNRYESKNVCSLWGKKFFDKTNRAFCFTFSHRITSGKVRSRRRRRTTSTTPRPTRSGGWARRTTHCRRGSGDCHEKFARQGSLKQCWSVTTRNNLSGEFFYWSSDWQQWQQWRQWQQWQQSSKCDRPVRHSQNCWRCKTNFFSTNSLFTFAAG